MQTRSGAAAHGMTAMEFKDVIAELRQLLYSRSNKKHLHLGQKWQLSIDNDSAHGAANLGSSGVWPDAERWYQPALSPDLNKVAEHVHAFITPRMHQWHISRRDNLPSVEECKSKLRELFLSYTKESIARDVQSMPATYQAVIDAGGLYVPKPYR